ncbi:MAG: DUF86 domain-containing protein [Candidatus Omnitrophica bacterium]|nr:DUF86 domain-containing protein [Candidatus Omnitrophota bacterium]
MRDYKLYLIDILAAMESIESFIADMNLETFEADDKTTSAVLRKLEVIGEAVKQIHQCRMDASPPCGGDGRKQTFICLWNRYRL